jgi:hypothetical protein
MQFERDRKKLRRDLVRPEPRPPEVAEVELSTVNLGRSSPDGKCAEIFRGHPFYKATRPRANAAAAGREPRSKTQTQPLGQASIKLPFLLWGTNMTSTILLSFLAMSSKATVS